MTKHILSVDGGGVRGIIPALVLAEIERKSRKPIADIFDLMAGTSTGGIVVAGLCKRRDKCSANDLVKLYENNGQRMFESSCWRRSIASWLMGARYSCANLEYILDEYFGGSLIADVSSHLLLTSYDIRNNCPFFFKSWKEDRNSVGMKDALRASTAAPTYFAPKCLKLDRTERVLVDGGVFANNPAACAYASGKRLFPNEDIEVLSIGTGRSDVRMEYADSKRLGKIGWIKPLLGVMFASSLDAVDYQLGRIMGDGYVRIQTQLKVASAEMDDVTADNIGCLHREANSMIEEHQEAIDRFCNI